MQSRISKWSIVLNGHKTSVSLEECFWIALREIASERNTSASKLINDINESSDRLNLSSAIRQYVLVHFWVIAVSHKHKAPMERMSRELVHQSSQHAPAV